MRTIGAVVAAFAIVAVPGLAGSTSELAQVDVSNAPGPQSETTITIDPSNSQILLAGANDKSPTGGFTSAFYSSVDGGATWTQSVLALRPSSDPAVAIDRTGRQYTTFLLIYPTNQGEPRVSSRPNAFSAWSTPTVVEQVTGTNFDDDKPAIAVDLSPASPHLNRVYLAWTRIIRGMAAPIVLAHSDNGGTTWSAPTPVSAARRVFQSYASIALGRDGTVYVAWWNVGQGIFVNVSHDGGETFGTERRLDAVSGTSSVCDPSGIRIPAQPTSCVRPDPTISVDNSTGPRAGRVYVTYSATVGKRQQQGVFVAALDPALRPLFLRHRLPRPRARFRSDQFWPASAVDSSTGVLWACFYDTGGDRRRRRAWYSCTRSRDGGRRWPHPVRVASVPSNETQPGADRGGVNNREYGDYEGLAVAGGVAHPVWTDTRRLRTLAEEVYTTTLSELSFRTRSRR